MKTGSISMQKYFNSLILLVFVLTVQSFNSHAQEQQMEVPTQNYYEGVVVKIEDQKKVGQSISIQITKGDKKDQTVISIDPRITTNTLSYKPGDKVFLLGVLDNSTGQEDFYITDFNRRSSLLWLFILFCIVVIAVSKKWGVTSLLGMVYSFFVIFTFILPQLLKGHNPLFIAILGALFIAPVTFYLSHGFNNKTTVALFSTVISLFITGVLSLFFINVTRLTGFGSEEAFFLQIAKDGVVNIKGIFLAGIIIGSLGILDDITISQSSIVYQLKNSVKGIDNWELYKKAMEVGHDHIASTVNTLVLVYTGAALPLLLLFINSTKTFGEAINAEIIADEIVRTLVGSIGLVLAVPISTLLAVYFGNSKQDSGPHRHSH